MPIKSRIIKEFNGVRVGDVVMCILDKKYHYGYVAAINAEFDRPYMLRLYGHNGVDSSMYWNEWWYPHAEKRRQFNCTWATQANFQILTKLVVYCPYREDYEALVDEIGCKDGRKSYEDWDWYEENTGANIIHGKIWFCSEIDFERQHSLASRLDSEAQFVNARQFFHGKDYIGILSKDNYDLKPFSSAENEKYYNNKSNKLTTKLMDVIKQTFKTDEDKAMEYYGLGTKDSLTKEGRAEFLDFMYETGTVDKKEFLKKIVEQYKKDKKSEKE